jgi:menaquinol-cytochrome c reductase iron-sulfur subunit
MPHTRGTPLVIFVASDLDPSREDHHAPGPSLWPVGFAVGVVVLLVGFVVSWAIVAIGIFVAVFFGFLWIRELTGGTSLADEPAEVKPEKRPPRPAAPVPRPVGPHLTKDRYPRNVFLEASTLGLGAVIGGLVTLPVLGFMVGPAFLKQGVRNTDIGPISDYPEGEYLVTTFTSTAEGSVSRRTAFVRNNGFLGNQPSFTIISNHCAHLGCPVEPNGEPQFKERVFYRDVRKIPVNPSGFGCPCHGGQYDNEGNRIAGPPVRALDRYSFSIVNGHLFVGKPFSVSKVDGTGAGAKIHVAPLSFPGEWVNGPESWLYPIQPPH